MVVGCGPFQSCPWDAPSPGAHHGANVMLSLMGFFRGLAAVAACPPSVHWAQREGRPSGDITDTTLFAIRNVMCTSTTSCLGFYPCSCWDLSDACAGQAVIDDDAGLTCHGKHYRQGSTVNAFAFMPVQEGWEACQSGRDRRILLYHFVFLNIFK